IEGAQQKIDRLEEEIISEMLLADDIEKEIKEASQKAISLKEKLSKEKKGLQQKSREMEEKKKELLQKKDKLVPKIPQGQYNLYLKIYNKKNGIALSPVRDEFCSMCHMRIRPQMLNELKAESKLVLCENCGRILYWQEKSV
ncbi:MAG: zinc ribbon domain-containing protein, partial [Candidatus Aminicenantales bacterium]